MHVLCSPLKGEKPLSEDIKLFLDRFPLTVHINCCEFVSNARSGLLVEDFWKGQVLISQSKFNFNKHSGIILSAIDYPQDTSLFKSGKTNDLSSFIN